MQTNLAVDRLANELSNLDSDPSITIVPSSVSSSKRVVWPSSKPNNARINVDRRWSKFIGAIAIWCKKLEIPYKQLNSQSLFGNKLFKPTPNILIDMIINCRIFIDKKTKVSTYIVAIEAIRYDLEIADGKEKVVHHHMMHTASYQFSIEELINYTKELKTFRATFIENVEQIITKVDNLWVKESPLLNL